jgi:hypothetical protein
MKKPSKRIKSVAADDILPEYDFSHGRRNPYAERIVTGGHLVVIEPDVAEAFPDAAAVNDALRVLAKVAARSRGRRPTHPSRRSKSARP